MILSERSWVFTDTAMGSSEPVKNFKETFWVAKSMPVREKEVWIWVCFKVELPLIGVLCGYIPTVNVSSFVLLSSKLRWTLSFLGTKEVNS